MILFHLNINIQYLIFNEFISLFTYFILNCIRLFFESPVVLTTFNKHFVLIVNIVEMNFAVVRHEAYSNFTLKNDHKITKYLMFRLILQHFKNHHKNWYRLDTWSQLESRGRFSFKICFILAQISCTTPSFTMGYETSIANIIPGGWGSLESLQYSFVAKHSYVPKHSSGRWYLSSRWPYLVNVQIEG